MNRSDSNEYANFRIEENVVIFEYKGGVMIDLKAAEKIVHDRVKFQEGKPYPVLCDTRLLSDTDKEARDYLAKEVLSSQQLSPCWSLPQYRTPSQIFI